MIQHQCAARGRYIHLVVKKQAQPGSASIRKVGLRKHLGTAADNTHAAQLRPDALSFVGGALSCSLPVLRHMPGHLCRGDVLNSNCIGSSMPCKYKGCTFMSQSFLSAFLTSSGAGSDIGAAPLALKALIVCHGLQDIIHLCTAFNGKASLALLWQSE